jgi:hypothetical protein
MKAAEFILCLKESFTGYDRTPEQLNVIKDNLDHAEPDVLLRLIAIVQKEFKQKYNPPGLADILNIAKKHELPLNASTVRQRTQWECGQCGEVYDYETRTCPNPVCGKSTATLPVHCRCGTYYPDSFRCCYQKKNGVKYWHHVEGVRNDSREQSVICSECGKEWTRFYLDRKPFIFRGRCKGPEGRGCGRPRTEGLVVRQ